MSGKAKFHLGDIVYLDDDGTLGNPFRTGDMGILVNSQSAFSGYWWIDFNGFKGNLKPGRWCCLERRFRLATNQEIQERYLG